VSAARRERVGYRPRVPSVFLSHSQKDATVAASLHARLKSEGIFSWLDEAELRPGDSLIGKIQAAIAEVDYVAVLLSPAAVASPWVQKEVEVALNQEISGRRVKVIPILVEPCAVPSFLSDKLYADLTQDFEAGLSKLLRRLVPNKEGGDVRRSHAERLLSLGYDRWNVAEKAGEKLLAPADLEEVVGHVELASLAPHVLTYLVRSAVLACADQPDIRVGPLTGRLGTMPVDVMRRELAPLLHHEQLKVRFGAVRLLAMVDGAAELLLEAAGRESDRFIRIELFEWLDQKGRLTPEIARGVLDSNESDWRIVARALRYGHGVDGALVISDGTELSSEIAALVRSAGYRAVTLPGYLVLDDLLYLPAPLFAFRLLVLVRGEGYSRDHAARLYNLVTRYVQHGGDVFATAWAAWEARPTPAHQGALPVVLREDAFIEDVTRTVRLPTGAELSVTGSFEQLGLQEGAEAWATFTDGSPFLAVRRPGAGTSMYLNVCQHSCSSTPPSPLRQVPELTEVLAAALRWLRTAPSLRPSAPRWTPRPSR